MRSLSLYCTDPTQRGRSSRFSSCPNANPGKSRRRNIGLTSAPKLPNRVACQGEILNYCTTEAQPAIIRVTVSCVSRCVTSTPSREGSEVHIAREYQRAGEACSEMLYYHPSPVLLNSSPC